MQLGTRMNGVDFEVKRSESFIDYMWSIKHFGVRFLTCPRNAWTPPTVTRYRVCIILMTFSWSWFRGQGHTQHLPKMHFSGGGITMDSSPSVTMSSLNIIQIQITRED